MLVIVTTGLLPPETQSPNAKTNCAPVLGQLTVRTGVYMQSHSKSLQYLVRDVVYIEWFVRD